MDRKSILIILIFLVASACVGQSSQTTQTDAKGVAVTSYQTVLGKLLNDKDVANFIATNHCTSAAEFKVCKEAGMALWVDTSQIVKMVYMYSGNSDAFRRYRGPLPFGLSFYDPMWRVKEKLRGLNVDDSLSLQDSWQAGLPDEEGSPDHIHYWAIYKRYGMTVLYNSAGYDEDAYIYAIVVGE
ncbi:MAG TPA: hypothetical protein VFQ23_02505 [Anaerolineales bacterium]|nr:hypothetical protein [Anaerolineales bacterium]